VRVLIATDGSSQAEEAVALAAAQAWPEGSELRVVVVDDGSAAAHMVVPGTPIVAGIPGPGGIEAGLGGAPEDPAALAERTAEGLDGRGWSVSSAVLRGRPGSAIVEEGERFAAGVIVVGSRGRGLLQAAALGSVSAEVVDHAGRPVLVARAGGPIRRVLLADDGSAPAGLARQAVAEWPIFANAEIDVVSVTHLTGPLRSAIAPTMYRTAVIDYERTLTEMRAIRGQALDEAVGALEAAGRRAVARPREGDPAHQIIDAAREQEADLVVVGSRGHGGLTRLLLGSVARNVLYGAPCSVLVVR
jgi:nucleotide-binding universal stress UspA family protein